MKATCNHLYPALVERFGHIRVQLPALLLTSLILLTMPFQVEAQRGGGPESGGKMMSGQEAGNFAVSNQTSEAAEDMRALEQFLKLTDEELDELIETLQRLRSLSKTERAKLAGQILEFRRLPREERRAMRYGWGSQSPLDRDAWRNMMMEATPEERTAIQQRLQKLSPEERSSYRETLIQQWRESQNPSKMP